MLMFNQNLLGRTGKYKEHSVVVVGESLDGGVHKVKVQIINGSGKEWIPKSALKMGLAGREKVDRKRVTLADGREVYIGMRVLNSKGKERFVTGYNIHAPSKYVKVAEKKGSFKGQWVGPDYVAKWKAADPVKASIATYSGKVSRWPLPAKIVMTLGVAFVIDYFVFNGSGYDKIKAAVGRLCEKCLGAIESKVASS
jgi:hypothetical protein